MTFTIPAIPKKVVIPALIIVLLLLAGIPSYYFYSRYQAAQYQLKNPTAAAREEAKKILARVGTLIELPADEEPTIATVTDREKLKDQAFFANAQNGDKVIIYTQSKKAILYRLETNKIIEVAPVTIGQNTATPSAAAAVKTKFVLLNGTTTTGLTKKYETELKTKIANAEVADRDNAKHQQYEKTMLVDLTGNAAAASQAAQVLGIATSELPKDEVRPTGAEFLIIVGADKK